jgi:hypothetical protein
LAQPYEAVVVSNEDESFELPKKTFQKGILAEKEPDDLSTNEFRTSVRLLVAIAIGNTKRMSIFILAISGCSFSSFYYYYILSIRIPLHLISLSVLCIYCTKYFIFERA